MTSSLSGNIKTYFENNGSHGRSSGFVEDTLLMLQWIIKECDSAEFVAEHVGERMVSSIENSMDVLEGILDTVLEEEGEQ